MLEFTAGQPGAALPTSNQGRIIGRLQWTRCLRTGARIFPESVCGTPRFRAIHSLEVGDPAWWENLDRLVGLVWPIQFRPTPQQNRPGPALPQNDLQEIRDAWLALSPEDLDRQYHLTPKAFGYHPSQGAGGIVACNNDTWNLLSLSVRFKQG